MASYWRTLGEYVEGLDRAEKLVCVTTPINKDTELHPLVRLQFRGQPEEEHEAALAGRHYETGEKQRQTRRKFGD